MSKKNFITDSLRVRFKITEEDDDKTIKQKIEGTWRDPNAPKVEGLDFDEEGFLEF